jgi:hypothetical protein
VRPNLVVIGAMKCATTSLHYYLGLHPEISMSAEKELHFFVAERNWSKGLAWYERHFAGSLPVRGESSTTYTRFPQHAGVPARMHAVVPEARLVYVVRDPVARAVSHYLHEYAAGREHRSLREALADTAGNPYVDASRYATQLEQYLPYYPRERILVVDAEDLRARRTETLRQVFAFLGVRETFEDRRFAVTKHETRVKRRLGPAGRHLAWLPDSALVRRLPPMVRRVGWQVLSHPLSTPLDPPALDGETRARLVDRLRPEVDRFQALTGHRVAGWER